MILRAQYWEGQVPNYPISKIARHCIIVREGTKVTIKPINFHYFHIFDTELSDRPPNDNNYHFSRIKFYMISVVECVHDHPLKAANVFVGKSRKCK